MEHEAAFLSAIHANPLDATTRLMFARWLEERGDPRAAYLRLATYAAGRVRDGSPWDDLKAGLRDACAAAPAEWRGQVGPWFDVVLEAVPPGHWIGVAKVILDLTHRGLADVKAMMYGLPAVVRSRQTLDEAEYLREQLEPRYGVSPVPSGCGPACQVALRICS